MLDLLHNPLFAATGIPPDSALARLSPIIGGIIFFGSIYMLLRSNLGSRRGYLVFGTSLFGFMVIMSMFWAFGAPGTPIATGPTNLPGQVPNEYQPTWTAFAETSRIAEDPRYAFVTQEPGRFTEVPDEFADEAEVGVNETQNFFSSEEGGEIVAAEWAPVETEYAEAENGYPVLRITYQETDAETQELIEDGEQIVLYGAFDAGSPVFPGVVFLLVSLVLFVLHAFLLDRDETRERRERAADREPQREPVGASA